MLALGGASTQRLRFLDKLIVASRRQSDANGVAKREKDVFQASLQSRHWRPPVARTTLQQRSRKHGEGGSTGARRY